MKKSFMVFIAAALLALSIGGCNENNETSRENSKSETSSVTENSSDNSSSSETEKTELVRFLHIYWADITIGLSGNR